MNVAQATAVALVGFSFVSVRISRGLHPDHLQTLFVLFSMVTLIRYRRGPHWGLIVIGGAAAGLAFATKFLGGLVFLPWLAAISIEIGPWVGKARRASQLLSGAIAGASPFSWRTGGTGCTAANSADSSNHGFYYNGDLSSAMRAATEWNRTANLEPTDLTTFVVTAEAPDTDVVVLDQNYTNFCGYSWHGSGGGVVGLTTCVLLATNPASSCEKFQVRYDESFTVGASTAQRRLLACHEVGHTLGLGHTTGNTCMQVPTQIFYTPYSAHEVIDHINASY